MDATLPDKAAALVERLSVLEKIRLVAYGMRKLGAEWQQSQAQPQQSLYGP